VHNGVLRFCLKVFAVEVFAIVQCRCLEYQGFCGRGGGLRGGGGGASGVFAF